MFRFGASWISNGGSMSIGSFGSVGSCSCAGKVAAKARMNSNATERIIAELYHKWRQRQKRKCERANEAAVAINQQSLSTIERKRALTKRPRRRRASAGG